MGHLHNSGDSFDVVLNGDLNCYFFDDLRSGEHGRGLSDLSEGRIAEFPPLFFCCCCKARDAVIRFSWGNGGFVRDV